MPLSVTYSGCYRSTEMEVKVISKQNIKPSTPTPNHLRIHKLSSIDQVNVHAHLPFVLFYPNNQSMTLSDVVSDNVALLKKSLSETLTHFYPLAGEFKGDMHIECNDNGVYYVEAKVDKQLSDIFRNPKPALLHQLFPYHPAAFDHELLSKTFIVMIQVNIFSCGGIAIGSYTSHKLLDGYSFMTFWKAWATTARGTPEQIYPSFLSPKIFPPNHALHNDGSLVENPSNPASPTQYNKRKCVARRFVFDASALNALKAKVTASSSIKNPTRVMVVIGLIWKCAMAASKAKFGFQKPSVMSVLVNLRRKASPALPPYSIGNIIAFAIAEYAPETDLELSSVIECLQEAVSKVDTNFIEELKGEEGYINMIKQLEKLKEIYSNNVAEYYVASSLCNEGIYEVDFGWGKPTWITHGGLDIDHPALMNTMFLMESNAGDGIEALVSLDESCISILEHDPELLAFATVNPNLLEGSNL